MLFNSYVFIAAFLPAVLCIYYLLNHFQQFKLAQMALIAASFVFYGYKNPKLCLLLLSTILVNYTFHRILIRQQEGIFKKMVLWLGIIFNFSLLFYFKYLNFSLDTIYHILDRPYEMKSIVLPLGISFFTFQQVSMLVDSSKAEMPCYGFWDYALFVSFFPQLVAGPIVLHQELIPQFHDLKKKKVDYENIIVGLEYFIFGFSKKVLIADWFANICDVGYSKYSELNAYSTILTILAYTLQIYFDFSGYCDMAMGLGKLFNFDIPMNFNSPYKAHNISEFWKRWHMTLTRFLTQYLYIPLGGNRRGKVRTYINVMIVFTLSGLWHGADWSFVIWGFLHGAMLVLYRAGRKVIDKLPGWFQWMVTFGFINVAWMFFRSEFTKQPLWMLRRLITGGGGWCQDELLSAACDSSLILALFGGFVSGQVLEIIKQIWVLALFGLACLVCVKFPSSHDIVAKKYRSGKYFAALGMLFFWAHVYLTQVSKFIYFNF